MTEPLENVRVGMTGRKEIVVSRELTVGHHVDGMARALEQVRQPVPQQGIIFDNEDFHGVPNLSVIRRIDGGK